MERHWKVIILTSRIVYIRGLRTYNKDALDEMLF